MWDLHVHTDICDGKDSPEAVAAAAARMGLSCLGFSGHSHTPFDGSYCMSEAGTEDYRRRVNALKEQYRGRLRILCGLEQDFYAPPAEGYDYLIGSVHYVLKDGIYYPVDESAAASEEMIAAFGGDPMAAAEAYYALVGQVAEKTGCRIIGHFDLITKFNEQKPLFDTAHPRYRRAWQQAAEKLLTRDIPFEINFGAIFRGYRQVPYPSAEQLRYLKARGARFVLSSDSHSAETLCGGFEAYAEYRSSCPV